MVQSGGDAGTVQLNFCGVQFGGEHFRAVAAYKMNKQNGAIVHTAL
jgi:hypothetical protein